jgi:hypothetical protein
VKAHQEHPVALKLWELPVIRVRLAVKAVKEPHLYWAHYFRIFCSLYSSTFEVVPEAMAVVAEPVAVAAMVRPVAKVAWAVPAVPVRRAW